MSQVANKAIHIGSAGAEPFIIASSRDSGKLPIKFFYNQVRESNWEFVVPETSKIETIESLRGSSIGVGALTNSHMFVTRAILKDVGLAEGSDFNFVAVGVGAPAFQSLMNGQIDTYYTWAANISSFEATGARLRRIPVEAKYRDIFQAGFFAHVDTIEQNPKLLGGFGRALNKASQICWNIPDWCVRNFWEFYPNLKPAVASLQDESARIATSVKMGWEGYFAFKGDGARNFGSYPDGSWQTLIAILEDVGAVEPNSVHENDLFTNDLVSHFNNFSQEEIDEQVKNISAK